MWTDETRIQKSHKGWSSCGVPVKDARNILTKWRIDYNRVRPHSALGMLTPKEFAESSQRNEVPVDQIFSR